MFKKLKKTFSNLDYVQGGKQISYGDVITYHDAQLAGGGVFFTIPLRYRDDFCLSVMTITGNVPPHTDSEIKCTINFYAEPNEYITEFFEPYGDISSYQVENQTNGKIFDRKNLTCTGAFVAGQGDAYLLDVTKIHAVEALDVPRQRVAICLGTDKHDFNAVSKMLEETGNL